MILNGLTITIVGMVVVFAFLILLVVAMNLLYFLLKRFLPKALEPKEDERPVLDQHPVERVKPADLSEIAAAIAAAKTHILSHS